MSFYTRRAGSTLAAAVKELHAAGSREADITEELDLARILADRSFLAFEAACLDPERSKDITPELKAMAIAQAREAVLHVAAVAEKAVKIRALSQAFVSAEDLQRVADSVVDVVRKALLDRGQAKDDVDATMLEVSRRLASVQLPSRDRVKVVIA